MSKQMQLKAKVGVAGRYRLRVGKRGQAPRIDTGWFDNIITDAGRNLMGGDGYMDSCQVGSGSTTPTVGDTSLATYVAGTSDVVASTEAAEASAPYYGSTTVTYRFAAGDAAGNLSEVGIGTATSGGTLFSRALITDGGGSPTSITVLADEFLDVTYPIQLVPPTGDITVSDVTDSGPAGTVHAITLRASEVTSEDTFGTQGWTVDGTNSSIGEVELAGIFGCRAYNGAIGAITASPSGTSDNPTSTTTDAYVNNSLERTGTITFGLNDGNLSGGIQSLAFHFLNAGTWQAEFDPVIPKTNTDTLTIDVSVSWDRTTAL